MAAHDECLFLLGSPRSGTKLLRDLLDRHPRVAFLRWETECLPYWAARWPRWERPDTPGAFGRFATRAATSPYFHYRATEGRLDPVDWRVWRAACRGDFSAPGVFAGLARLETGAADGPGLIWGDKSPSYLRHLPRLAAWFPRARFVLIHRDVRDAAVSAARAWGKSPLRYAGRWCRDLLAARRAGRALGARSVEVAYEDLIAEPERELRRLCAALGLAFVPDMLTPTGTSETLGRARGAHGILADNAGGFRRALDAPTWQRIEEIAWPAMLDAGYVPERAARPRPLAGWQERLLSLRDAGRLAAGGGLAGAAFRLRRMQTSGNRW